MPVLTVRTFRSGDVHKLTGASLRQLQWWDECGILKPNGGIAAHIRIYDSEQVLMIAAIMQLLKRGMSNQGTKRIARKLHRLIDEPKSFFVVTDSKSFVMIHGDEQSLVATALRHQHPLFIAYVDDRILAQQDTRGRAV